MSKMSEINLQIHELLDTTGMSCQEVADEIGCPVEWVHEIVDQRWADIVNETTE